MLDPRELEEVAAAFGVADAQVRRDHLISHILAAVADLALTITFFGKTVCAVAGVVRRDEDDRVGRPPRRA